MAADNRFYFEKGLTIHTACAGDEVKNLRYLESVFDVKLVARDNWVEQANLLGAGDTAAYEAKFGKL